MAYKNPFRNNKEDFLKDASEMQRRYQEMEKTKTLTKRKMCELCVPFRDKYGLTDLQTLQIARREISSIELKKMAEEI